MNDAAQQDYFCGAAYCALLRKKGVRNSRNRLKENPVAQQGRLGTALCCAPIAHNRGIYLAARAIGRLL